MDMDTMIFEMKDKELENMKALLAQYQKELNDIKNNTGLAKMMTKFEARAAEKDLEEHIESLVTAIMSFETTYDYVV